MGAITRFWELVHISGDLYELRHDGGALASDISVSLTGAGVVNSQRDWSTAQTEMKHGDVIRFKFKRAMGAAQDPPVLQIRWGIVVDGVVHTSSADYPIPR